MRKAKDNKKGILKGITFALIPHIGCILFIVLSVIGVTVTSRYLQFIFFNKYLFYILIGVSLLFATISTVFYLKTNSILSLAGVKRKYKYILLLFGTTISINLLLFLVVFPYIANISKSQEIPANIDLQSKSIIVDIPCSGHAPLIINELKKQDGVIAVKFKLPKQFDIKFDGDVTSINKIMNMEIFKEFPIKK